MMKKEKKKRISVKGKKITKGHNLVMKKRERDEKKFRKKNGYSGGLCRRDGFSGNF